MNYTACAVLAAGKYTRALGRLWHPEHFICSRCRKPIGKRFLEHKGRAYCEKDYLELFGEKCALCNKPITGQCLADHWGNKYCKRHESDPRCFSCGRMIGMNLTGGGVRYKDGRTVCSICRRTAVDDDGTAKEVFSRAYQVLSQILDIKLNIDAIVLHLVGQKELDRAFSSNLSPQQSAGLTLTEIITINRAESRRSVRNILVLNGLPEEHLAVVLAHEIGHAWLFMNHFPKLPEKVEEGICELFEYFWLQQLDAPEAGYRLQMLEENKDPVYGRGYREAKQALSKYPFARLLSHVKKNRRFPR